MEVGLLRGLGGIDAELDLIFALATSFVVGDSAASDTGTGLLSRGLRRRRLRDMGGESVDDVLFTTLE